MLGFIIAVITCAPNRTPFPYPLACIRAATRRVRYHPSSTAAADCNHHHPSHSSSLLPVVLTRLTPTKRPPPLLLLLLLAALLLLPIASPASPALPLPVN